MRAIGIMQGRLTPSNGRGIQFFPFDNWKNEFRIGQRIGLDEIEFIFDYDRYAENPLWTEGGIREIEALIEETGVRVNSVCFDYFMRRPFFKMHSGNIKDEIRKENVDTAFKILEAMPRIKAKLLEIPFVDDSSIKLEEEEDVISFIREVADKAEGFSIEVGLETDLPPTDDRFAGFIKRIGKENVVANYDTGNSSGLGYNHRQELLSLNSLVANVHIKDRVIHGTTVKLGTGSADFDQFFMTLKEIGYDGSIILQAARDDVAGVENTIMEQIKFVKEYCEKYGL